MPVEGAGTPWVNPDAPKNLAKLRCRYNGRYNMRYNGRMQWQGFAVGVLDPGVECRCPCRRTAENAISWVWLGFQLLGMVCGKKKHVNNLVSVLGFWRLVCSNFWQKLVGTVTLQDR